MNIRVSSIISLQANLEEVKAFINSNIMIIKSGDFVLYMV
uniref:Uncharacterized protein n=1 Tax=Siphoviridae sp. ctxMM9 TaxID=2827973 RepID=A0A8S5T6B6_9CAUD|nr:MAG TPA: hypothetical protein [Siphoviridae sp. ctxMM9]